MYQTPYAKKETNQTVLKIFAGIGAVALLIAVAAVIATGVSNTSLLSAVGSLFSNERIVVTAEPTVLTTGDEVVVSWEHENKTNGGSYEFSYDCVSGVSATYNDEALLCNMPSPIASSDNELTLTFVSDEEARVETMFRIAFTKNGKRVVSEEGEALLVVVNPELEEVTEPEVIGVSTTTPAPTNPGTRQTQIINLGTTTAPRFSDPNGLVDLSVRILAVGVTDDSGNFTPKEPVNRADKRPAVKFEVTNLGTRQSGPWRFNAHLPTRPSHEFESVPQVSIFPGEKVEYTLGFDPVADGSPVTFSVTLDPDNFITELSEANNLAGRQIQVID